MTKRIGVVVAALCAPLVAFAQTASEPSTEQSTEREVPAAEAPQQGAASGGTSGAYEPKWSLGAGVEWGTWVNSISTSLGSGVYMTELSTPRVTMSLERAVGPRTWLVLGASGAIGRHRADVSEGRTDLESQDLRQLALGVGVRQIVTSPGSPVDVSLVFFAEGGVADSKLHWVGSYSQAPTQQTAWTLGANAGIAIDRELTRGLSVRVGTSLLGVTWTRHHTKLSDETDLWSSDFSAGLDLQPYLQLRLAF